MGQNQATERPLAVEVCCRGFCDYYRGDGGEEGCGGLSFVRSALAAGRITGAELTAIGGMAPPPGVRSAALTEALCHDCAYRADGCDFMSADPPADATPCGGYRLFQLLLAAGVIENLT